MDGYCGWMVPTEGPSRLQWAPKFWRVGEGEAVLVWFPLCVVCALLLPALEVEPLGASIPNRRDACSLLWWMGGRWW